MILQAFSIHMHKPLETHSALCDYKTPLKMGTVAKPLLFSLMRKCLPSLPLVNGDLLLFPTFYTGHINRCVEFGGWSNRNDVTAKNALQLQVRPKKFQEYLIY